MNIEWPAEGGRPPLRTSHALDRRCCYWEFYTTEFEAPKEAVIGEAKVTIELPEEAAFITLTTTEIAAPIVKPKSAL